MKTIFDINDFIYNILGFSGGKWLLTASVLFAVLCFCFVVTVRNGRMKVRTFWIETGWTALWYAGLMALSLITYSPKGTALWQPGSPALVWCIAAVVVIFLYITYFLRRKKHFSDLVSSTAIRRSAAGSGASKYCYALLFAGMLVSAVICGMRLGCGDSVVHLLVPMLLVALSVLLFSLTHWKFWYLLNALLLIVYAFLTLQNELAETQFTYTPLLALLPLYLSSILPMLSLGIQKK